MPCIKEEAGARLEYSHVTIFPMRAPVSNLSSTRILSVIEQNCDEQYVNACTYARTLARTHICCICVYSVCVLAHTHTYRHTHTFFNVVTYFKLCIVLCDDL